MRQKIRTLIVIGLITSWSLVAVSGVVLYLTPRGQGVGRGAVFLGLTRWEILGKHPLLGLLAMIFSIMHILMEWRVFWALLKNLFRRKPVQS